MVDAYDLSESSSSRFDLLSGVGLNLKYDGNVVFLEATVTDVYSDNTPHRNEWCYTLEYGNGRGKTYTVDNIRESDIVKGTLSYMTVMMPRFIKQLQTL